MPKITLKAARINVGLTQEAAAKRLGIDPSTLAKYEKDSGKLSREMLRKISKLYGISEIFLK
ncbi:helix-turn-helix domain-containing protein [Lactobacillus porci]|uniref:helix-turn-helix domain-containing protein n=1 Tax=Lactobacillus porci TaxID=2012477 RepID=UPI0039924ECC